VSSTTLSGHVSEPPIDIEPEDGHLRSEFSVQRRVLRCPSRRKYVDITSFSLSTKRLGW
jgi:hypothetical protein